MDELDSQKKERIAELVGMLMRGETATTLKDQASYLEGLAEHHNSRSPVICATNYSDAGWARANMGEIDEAIKNYGVAARLYNEYAESLTEKKKSIIKSMAKGLANKALRNIERLRNGKVSELEQ